MKPATTKAGHTGEFNPDEAWLARSKSTFLDRHGETVRHRIEHPDSDGCWISVSTRWDSPESKQLENEHMIAKHLDHSYAVLPSGFIRSQHGPVLVYDGDAHTCLSTLGQSQLSIEDFLSISVAASLALSNIHARQILHRDIRPSHIHRSPDGEVRFASFGRATSIGQQSDDEDHPIGDELLPYAAPEFARRANFHADERSDLYSLGIVFYELLVGKHPYSASSTAEWLYAHVAFEPEKPSNRIRHIPQILDEIILKLIAKNPSHRYQSAGMLHADLTRCQNDWVSEQLIEAFELARESTLNLTGQLFGRQSEVEALRDTYECVRKTEAPAIAFLAGPPGSGKTALAQGLLEGLQNVEISVGFGKSDQHQRQTPYAPVRQALQSLVDVLIGQGRSELSKARERLHDRLGANARLIADLVPELELVLGKTPAVTDLPADAARDRMNLALIQVLTAFAAKGTPLILILDDIQWADPSTWAFLRKFSDIAPRNVMMIATYRDNEVLHQKNLECLRSGALSNAVSVCDIQLGPLSVADVTALMSNAMNCEQELVRPLAQIVHAKTDGNAFFAGQFLRALVDEQIVSYDRSSAKWAWDTGEVERRSHTDNVLDLMVRRLERLSGPGRRFMEVLACIGSRADDAILARALDSKIEYLRELAKPLMEAGLLCRDGGYYGFAHDRILESAYALIPESHRALHHSRIAILMIDFGDDTAFERANQVQRAGNHAVNPETRSAFISTLAAAARKARAAAAIGQAWNYLTNATDLLGEDAWSDQYHLAYEVNFLRCECLIVQVKLDQAFIEIENLIRLARAPIDLALAYRLRASVLTLRSDYEGTITSALMGLDLLDIHLKRHPSEDEILLAYAAVNAALNGRDILTLGELPVSTDPQIHAAMELLVTLLASIFIDDGISFLHVAKIVELTLLHGPTPASAHGLAWFGVFSADRFGVYQDGFNYGQAALLMIERNGWEVSRPGVLVAVDQVSAWTQPLSYSLARAREAAAAGHAGGDLAMACYAGNHIVSNLLCMGHPLSAVTQEAGRALALAQRIQFKDIERLISAQLAFSSALTGASESDQPINHSPDDFSEFGSSAVSQSTLFWEWLYRGMTAFFQNDLERASKNFEAVGRLTWAVPAHINLADYHLFAALTASQSNALNGTDSESSLADIAIHREKLKNWAAINPTTFANKLLLVDAEIARLQGDAVVAMQLYEASADAALSANFLHEYALANELAAAHDQSFSLRSAARGRLRAAKNGYRRWGAIAKVTELESSHPFLAVEVASPSGAASGQPALDVAVAMEVARTLSEEIQLDRLIEKLMRGMVVHAGANYGLLVLIHNEEPVIEAVAELLGQSVAVTSRTMAPNNEMIPMTVLNTVLRTRKPIVIDDASQAEFIEQAVGSSSRSPKSISCVPLIKQGNLVGVLYLENNLTTGVFTPNRTAMLEILAPQAAICLETARLYAELVEQNERRRNSQIALRNARAELAKSSHLSAMGGLTASISHEISQPLSSIQSNADASFRWLQRSEPNIDEALLNVQSIRTDASRATAIVSAIRALAKRSPSTLVPVSIDRLITEVLEITSAELEAKQVMISTSLNVNDYSVLGDPIQLQQVILNLVTNASDAMLESDKRELSVVSFSQEAMIVVAVQDTGLGMSDETKLRIFDPLYTTKDSGMGMGMAICRTIIEAHQGKLEVQSTSSVGTTIAFKLPLSS